MGLCRLGQHDCSAPVFTNFIKLTQAIILLLAVALVCGCGGGRSGTNSGGSLKFGVVFDYRDAETNSPVSGVVTDYFDQTSTSALDGTSAFTINQIDAALLFQVSYQDTIKSVNLKTPASYNLEENQGIYVVVDITATQVPTEPDIRIREIIPIPKIQKEIEQQNTEDPLLPDQDVVSDKQSDLDNPRPDLVSTPTPTPAPTPEVSALTAVVEGVVLDSQGEPLSNVGVHVGLQGLDQRLFTGPEGTFEFKRTPIYLFRSGSVAAETSDQGFLHLRVGGHEIDITVTQSYNRESQKYSIVITLGEDSIKFNSRIEMRNHKPASADIVDTEQPKPNKPDASPAADVPVDSSPDADVPLDSDDTTITHVLSELTE